VPQISGTIGIDEAGVYFAGWDTPSPPEDGGNYGPFGFVGRVPLAGGQVETLATPPQGVGTIAVGASYVAWAGSDATVYAVPLGGGAVTTVVGPWPVSGPGSSLAMTGPNVVWPVWNSAIPNSEIVSVPIAGGPATTVVSGVRALTLAVDATNVYWTDADSCEIGAAPIAGGSPTSLAQLVSDCPGSSTLLASDGVALYYATYAAPCSGGASSCTLAFAKVPVGGGAPVTLATQSEGMDGNPPAVAVDDTSLYFTSDNGLFKVTPK
jgi:hypothetical protein